jgi:peptidoglycan hydrolase-like protein with peptidoglycan-binding domain
MKHLNKLASVFCVAAMGLTALTGCEGSDMFSVNSPDWLSEKIDSIEKSKVSTEEVLVGMNEDVYTVGNTDFSSGFWSSFSKYYVVQDNQKWNAVFNLNINPSATNTYKNFALIITNDVDRGGTGYTEYGAIRFDNQPSGNSEWGDHIDRSCVQSNLTFETDTDKGVDKLGGKVTLTVDRSRVDTFMVKITNGTVTKTYIQPSKIANLNADESNTNIRCFLVPEGSFIDFQQSNVEPIGGYTSAQDKAPVSMVLNNVPAEVDKGTTLEEAMQNVSATVTFEEGVTKVIPASELLFSAINDMDEVGEKTLIAIYNKTFKGENAATPIVANAKFNVVAGIKTITVTQAPTRTNYYYYNSAAVDGVNHTLAFDPTGMVVYATYVEGEPGVIDNSKLTFSRIPATAGKHEVTITTENGRTATVEVNVAESAVKAVTPTPVSLGAEDCSTAWWTEFTENMKIPAGETFEFNFTNYSSGVNNWNNYVVILRKADLAEYAVVRSDNYGWGNGYAACTPIGTQGDWATWLATMNGAKVKMFVTNCNNGTADIQAIVTGTDGSVTVQNYLGINTIDPSDLNVAFTVDSSHLKFGSAAARKHYTRAHRR